MMNSKYVKPRKKNVSLSFFRPSKFLQYILINILFMKVSLYMNNIQVRDSAEYLSVFIDLVLSQI
jgi:hypothetical protein